MNHDLDFSRINFEYLLQARNVAKQHPEMAASLLGIPPETIRLLAKTPPDVLGQIHQIRAPLLTPRQGARWWQHLFLAMNRNEPEEIECVLKHAALISALKSEGNMPRTRCECNSADQNA